MSETHRDAQSAWDWLIKKGAIEPDGRDAPLVEILRVRTDPEASTLPEALSHVSLTAFLDTFFGVISPFVSMMRDLLEYFERAEAVEGPVNWILALGDDSEELEVSLDAFKKWIKTATHGRNKPVRTVPDLTYHELWDIRKCFYPARQNDVNPDADGLFYKQPEPKVKSAELTKWMGAYDTGHYLDLPSTIEKASADKSLISEVAALLIEIYGAIRVVAHSRSELKRKGPISELRGDLWSASGLWHIESDFWVKGRVLDLEAYADADEDKKALVLSRLAEFLEKRPRRRMREDVDINDLEEILSLPAWQRRYELYSAWILTVVLKALNAEGHATELHHENGRISFSFRETLMARVLSAVPPLEIFSERRVALSDPIGPDRSHGAQPDYSFWSDERRCPLAIECKHYKRSSARNFSNALNDYSSALRSAEIILVNYGPVGAAVDKAIKNDRRDRCIALGNVNPDHVEEVERLQSAVARVVGEPRKLPSRKDIQSAVGDVAAELLVIDVSGSMADLTRKPSGQGVLRHLIRSLGGPRP